MMRTTALLEENCSLLIRGGAQVADKETEDLYVRFKTLQRQLEFVEIQEEYVKDETKNLKREKTEKKRSRVTDSGPVLRDEPG